jgi:site-specific DNA recombinase
MRAAIYCRISLDREGEGQGVDRQLADCRALIQERSWVEAATCLDNDISAFNGRKRPGFERLLEMLKNQEVDTVVVWKTDRLARRGRDLQRFLDAAGTATLTSCTEPEFTGATGLLMLRIINGFAEHESGVKSERVARKMKEKAERGDPHAGGKRTFGFTADGKTLQEQEACLLRQAAQRILAGETLTAVLTDWTRQGVPTPAGGRWSPSNLSRLLRSPKLAGLREYHGELHQGTWPAVLDRPTWERLRATLGQRKQVSGRKYLLTGLLVCGRCGAHMTGGARSGNGTISYKCRSPIMGGCGRCSIAITRAEPYVTRTVLAALEGIERHQEAGDEAQALLEALRAAEADLAQASRDHYVEKLISREEYLAVKPDLEWRIDALRKQVASLSRDIDKIGPDVAEQWETQSLSWRQSVLKAVLDEVVVHPGLGTRAAIGDRLTLAWRA